MFIGHYAVGFAAKKWAPKVSLGALFAAAIWLDLVWPIFVVLGLEKFNVTPGITRMSPFDFTDYPLSHSLIMAIVWGMAFGLVYLILDNQLKNALILGGLVVSHWFLDLIVHRQDLPIFPAEFNSIGVVHKYGFGLWNHWVPELLLEGGLFAVGLWLYWKATKTRDRVGFLGLLSFVLFLLVAFVFSLTAPPPNNPDVIAFMGQFLQLLLIGWAYWFDDHRKSV